MDGQSMEDLQISYEGAPSLIEANTLINSLLHFTTIVQETNKELQPDKKVEIKIKANREGSFLVDLVIISQPLLPQITGIFQDPISAAKTLVKAVTDIYSLVKFLKGTKPKEITTIDNSVRIENNSGDVTYMDNRTFNIYQDNASVRYAISQEFETLSTDENITAFEIKGADQETIVSIPREDFRSIASPEEFKFPDEKFLIKTGILYIASLSFERNINWIFYYDGNKYSAKIKDEEFTRLIDSGERFGKGDCLEAEFEVRQQFDDTIKTYINKSIKVLRIIKHFTASEQQRLKLE